MSSKAGFHQRLLDFLQSLVENRLRHHQGTAESDFFFDKATVQAIRQSEKLAAVFKKHPVREEEVILVLLALVPHLRPGFYSQLVEKLLPEGGDFPEFGGVRGSNHRGILPTGETALFLLAGDCIGQRLKVQELLRTDSWLVEQGLLRLEPVKEGEPTLSGRLILDEEVVELLTTGRVSPPRFSSDFAAEHLTTGQEWEDLVLNPATARQIRDIETWLQHNDTLLYDWGMHRKIKPGYRTLFYGPPGTGKTLTATLLGKYTGREVFRIDLSLIVSKYIGETEKNLSKIFDKARNKNWILFFDEADALFGKRTNVRDAHDKYANQEVSYLLQRIESYAGVIILASNMKSNIDDAFLRRFHSVIHFPKPTAEERLLLWEKALPPQVRLAKEVELPAVARKYDLTGSGIINVVQRICLDVLDKKAPAVTSEIFHENIRKEFEKEGRMV
jgi:hypothetical protein